MVGRCGICGRLAQLGERRVRNAEVRGSIPLPSTNLLQRTARSRGGSRRFLTATIVAFGTSIYGLLPELVAVWVPDVQAS